MIINFYKMHGLGNDFIIIDNTNNNISLTPEQIRFLCNRRLGIGCDQLVLTTEIIPHEMVKMLVFNADGSVASACGNATRCLGLHAMEKYKTQQIKVKTSDRILLVTKNHNNMIVNMGKASFESQNIPLANNNLNSMDLNFKDLNLPYQGVAVNVGNPHIVFVVDNVDTIDLANIGPQIETHHYFPNKTNVEFIQILDPNTIRMRVWERGTGITLACGTGSVASFAVASKLNLIANSSKTHKIKLILDGGELLLWYDDNHDIILEGEATLVFEGKIII